MGCLRAHLSQVFFLHSTPLDSLSSCRRVVRLVLAAAREAAAARGAGTGFAGAFVARFVVDVARGGARGFVSGAGALAALPGAARRTGWLVSASAIAASFRGCAGPLFSSCALRLSEVGLASDDEAGMDGP